MAGGSNNAKKSICFLVIVTPLMRPTAYWYIPGQALAFRVDEGKTIAWAKHRPDTSRGGLHLDDSRTRGQV